mgnify:CR=1 FL=1
MGLCVVRPWDFDAMECYVVKMILWCCAIPRKAQMNGIAVVNRIFNCRWRKRINPVVRELLSFLRADVHYAALQRKIDDVAEYSGMNMPLGIIPPRIPHPLVNLSDSVVRRAAAHHLRNTNWLEQDLEDVSDQDSAPWTDSEPYSPDGLDP